MISSSRVSIAITRTLRANGEVLEYFNCMFFNSFSGDALNGRAPVKLPVRRLRGGGRSGIKCRFLVVAQPLSPGDFAKLSMEFSACLQHRERKPPKNRFTGSRRTSPRPARNT